MSKDKAYDYKNIIETIDGAASQFESCTTVSEKILFEAAMNAARELDYDPKTGKIKTTTANIARLARIKAKLNDAATSNIYLQGVRKLAETFGAIHDEQLQYFRSNFAAKTLDEKSVRDKYAALRKATIENTIEGLTGQGLQTNVTDAISRMLMTAVTSGEKYADLAEQLHQELISSQGKTGSLARYASTYATTAMTQYAGQQNRMFTDDLDIKWFRYVGSTIETTRRFCELLTKKEYIHISEIPEILKGRITIGDELKTCPINPKTELPYGLIEGTTPENFAVNVGGWNCRHQLVPIAAEAVPKNIREKIEKKTPEQEWWEKNRAEVDILKKYLKLTIKTVDHLAFFKPKANVNDLENCLIWARKQYSESVQKWIKLTSNFNKLLKEAGQDNNPEYYTLSKSIKNNILDYDTSEQYVADFRSVKNAISELRNHKSKTKQEPETKRKTKGNKQQQKEELTIEKLLAGKPKSEINHCRTKYLQGLMNINEMEAKHIKDDILAFTMDDYIDFRKYQQGHKVKNTNSHGRTFNEMERNIEEFIEASPKWAGISYRGISLPKSIVKKYQVGDIIDMKGTNSWSTNMTTSIDYARKNLKKGYVSVIYIAAEQPKGTSIQGLSRYISEHEILCSKDARWEIQDIKIIDEKNIEIQVKSLE